MGVDDDVIALLESARARTAQLPIVDATPVKQLKAGKGDHADAKG